MKEQKRQGVSGGKCSRMRGMETTDKQRGNDPVTWQGLTEKKRKGEHKEPSVLCLGTAAGTKCFKEELIRSILKKGKLEKKKITGKKR